VNGIGESTAKVLAEHGFENAQSLADATVADIAAVPGFGPRRAATVSEAAKVAVLAAGSPIQEAESEANTVVEAELPKVKNKKKSKRSKKKAMDAAAKDGKKSKKARGKKDKKKDKKARKGKKRKK